MKLYFVVKLSKGQPASTYLYMDIMRQSGTAMGLGDVPMCCSSHLCCHLSVTDGTGGPYRASCDYWL